MKINGRKALGCQGQTFVLVMSTYEKLSDYFVSQKMVTVTLQYIFKLRVVNSKSRRVETINKCNTVNVFNWGKVRLEM